MNFLVFLHLNQTKLGRPSGGIAFFYHKSLNNCATRITVPNSHRVQGLKLKCTNAESVVFINTYFPTDPGGNQIDNTVLLETLQDIKYVIDSCDPNCKIVLLGDLNTDFIRNSSFTNLVVDSPLRTIYTVCGQISSNVIYLRVSLPT